MREIDSKRLNEKKQKEGIGDEDVTANSDVTLLAVKPQQMLDAMAQTGKGLQDKAMLSILSDVSAATRKSRSM